MPRIGPALTRVLLTLALSPILVTSAFAQARNASDARIIDGYRLSMPILRKVIPALYATGAESCPRDRTRDPHTMSIADMVQMLERCPPVVASLRQAGISTRDGAIVFASMLRTSQAVALQGGNAEAVPPGPLRENALLLQQHDSELKRLMTNGVPQ